MKKSGFTLVEMLIVVVIIGILSAALLPRLTGYMARTRDLKRQADLRNIAAAIEMYRADHGEFPKRNEISYYYDASYYVGSTNKLAKALDGYLNEIPRDPKKSQGIEKIYPHCFNFPKNCLGHKRPFENGEYFYQVNVFLNKAFLIAKVETLSTANYVARGDIENLMLGCSTSLLSKNKGSCTTNRSNFIPCNNITKGTTIKTSKINDTNCFYTSEDELYYVIEIK